ncbi:DUF6519 domain-containing protein [Polymorphobacter fuscus]|uniref:Uncharacterized protein n=1 Tax=Sandarakinorhabdus fusca TaxID=1439888 RepID=A0A7C9KXP5_9SPHN|nr:DUF6519 domain-containing protein [Polymorphobacter fuscus]KAB7647940.1 hypothetical protein F9290_08310 [Polymorphobacter fuscus]MQT17266.1 hypothetical protein [Polymorphobacter fuscus]NJC08739.1 hypothetical protein [Polymorphobacter fuscus]
MKGDFSRIRFDPLHRFSRVLVQQGRVTLDADANEQQAINLHLLRSLAADLIGRHGGPQGGFVVTSEADAEGRGSELVIGAGHYYVDGWLCENPAPTGYRGFGETPGQPWFRDPPKAEPGVHLAYLEVWERHVSAAEADRGGDIAAPDAIREVALDGPDTTSRAQVVWQVRLQSGAKFGLAPEQSLSDEEWQKLSESWFPAARGRMSAKAAEAPVDTGDPCTVSPRSRYRGIENQLYRVEIRRGGTAAAGASLAWSRENGAVTLPVAQIAGARVTLADAWRDERFALATGDIVELADDSAGLGAEASPLYRIIAYDPDSATVTLDRSPVETSDDPARPVLLRRWDHGVTRSLVDHEVPLVEDSWLTLEDGITIRFDSDKASPATYRAGDYWLIPARVALGDVLWPRDGTAARAPRAIPPHGIERHRAPLAIVMIGGDGSIKVTRDLTRRFRSLVELS